MKKFFENAKTKAFVVGAGVVVAGSNAMASGATLTAPTFDLSNVTAVGGALLLGVAGIWAIRRAISLPGR